MDNNKLCYDVASGEFFMVNEKELMEKLNKYFIATMIIDHKITYMLYDSRYFIDTLLKNEKAKLDYEKALDYASK